MLKQAPCSVRLGARDSEAGACPLVCGVRSSKLWGASLSPEVAEGSAGFKAACLLVGGAVSMPSELLGLRCPSTSAYRPLGQGRAGPWY